MAGAGAALLLLAASCSHDSSPEPAGGISYSLQLQPLFDSGCLSGCHVPGGVASFLDLSPGRSWTQLVNAPASSTVGTRVVPGDPAGSVLWLRVSGASAGPQMPLGGRPLGRTDQRLIRYWIAVGAPDN